MNRPPILSLFRREESLSVFSVHPGVVKTELSRTIYEVYGPLRWNCVKRSSKEVFEKLEGPRAGSSHFFMSVILQGSFS